MRRAQMEMIGLVFVVLIVAMGLVLYVSFSPSRAPGPHKEVNTYVSFLNAFAESDITSCGAQGMPVARVAQECAAGNPEVCGRDPCDMLQNAMDKVLRETLFVQNIKYNMSLEGTGISSVNDCDSASTGVYRSTLPLRSRALYLEICR